MELMLLSIAEIVRAAGKYVDTSPNDTARDTEVKLEACIMDCALVRYDHSRLHASDDHFDGDPFVFELTAPSDAEEVFWASKPIGDHTKMALARRLEIVQGDDRVTLWRNLRKSALLVAVDPAYVPPPAPPKGHAKGRGRGGRGRGRGRGKGRG